MNRAPTLRPSTVAIPLASLVLLTLLPPPFIQAADEKPAPKPAPAEAKSPAQRQADIKALVEQLVLEDKPATNRPLRNPNIKIYNAEGKEVKPADEKAAEAHRQRYEACEQAFQKLYEYKAEAFPVLVAHLDDKRQSIPFRNHYTGNSVGDACRWNIYFQLVDTPENYSSYGYSRQGRDGKQHPKPQWKGTPFDEEGGVKKWLDKHKNLTHVQMQIKALEWMLRQEKAIGAPDAYSYFENILPLEIRILERRQQSGEKVDRDLTELRRILEKKDATHIPADLLPQK